MGILEKLKDRGALIQAFSDKGKLLRVMWETMFLNDMSKSQKNSIYLSNYLWHVFSYEKLDCLEREEAIKSFNRIKKHECYIFYQRNDNSLALRNAQNIKAEDFNEEYDIYIVDRDFTWTYIHTHEYECGPYFYKK